MSNKKRLPKQIKLRPPKEDSPEIRKLVKKYPDLNKGKNDTIMKNRESVNNLWNKCNEVLNYQPAKEQIRVQQLKSILENHRLDMNI